MKTERLIVNLRNEPDKIDLVETTAEVLPGSKVTSDQYSLRRTVYQGGKARTESIGLWRHELCDLLVAALDELGVNRFNNPLGALKIPHESDRGFTAQGD